MPSTSPALPPPDREHASALRIRVAPRAARLGPNQRIGIGVARSTGTAVTLFFGEPSMTRSE